ncbi:imidazoleglycerol-phosphate dehydratase [Treponema brennaborense]|uniref:Imidazoleglycerol-phosphate dehydratase n=1 Tax=Treponema brennaborense (strain DSM 12168 / CIP 105900 / DD5/3) TaxID=906968 RepID=F4LLF2_TREBD|nr:imidazoleglycerol-phosphate dehydratase [Treponema brennaborense]AEE15630.1 Imidazoleglycerol-phosphate dehydratase [Treponema brennaborense DSM 12168]
MNGTYSRQDAAARTAAVTRTTGETDISLELNLDGTGACSVACPIGFFAHMLNSFCKHGLFDLKGSIAGDLHVDQHHLIEDTGIVLGQAFARALGDCAGIYRTGSCLYPMDETLARAAVDFGGRPYLVCEAALTGVPLVSLGADGTAASFQTDTFEDFWQGFVSGAKCNLHLDVLRGRSDHHKMEALFKAAARAVRDAVSADSRRTGAIPSTKGVIV